MKKYTLATAIVLLGLLTSGCDKAGFNSNITVTQCTEGNTSILSGDQLVKQSDGTVVQITDIDGSKEVCVISGSAVIYR